MTEAPVSKLANERLAHGRPEGARLADQEARAQALDPRGSFIVQAPAGSGKTELLTRRFLELLARVEEPEQILAITFTRAATAEMRTRVLGALKRARDMECSTNGDRSAGDPLAAAARAALQSDAMRGWKLLEQPQRLNIHTIDSLCLAIAQETPLLSRLMGSFTPVEDAEPLYATAARRMLARLGSGDADLSSAIRSLLELRETSLSDCEQLIAGMLARRDQWLRFLPLGQNHDWQQIQRSLEAPFAEEHCRVMARARALFAKDKAIAGELFRLLSYACANLRDKGNGSPALSLEGISRVEELTELSQWIGVCNFLLKKSGDWRAEANANIGFPAAATGSGSPARRQMKERFKQLIATLGRRPEFLEELSALRELPPLHYSPEQWQMLRHALVLLLQAVAELRVIFAEQGKVDFVELGLVAIEVLRNETDRLPADLATRWPHLLVDEFQDTSRSQYDLFSLLVEAREHPGTCFFVGDPMQSIYGFRQAEVELFEGTRRHGLGEGNAPFPLEPLGLKMNFRSHAGLVEPLNGIFQSIFSASRAGNGYQVAFAPSVASAPSPSAESSVHVIAQFLPSSASPEEVLAARRAEACAAVEIIKSHWSQVDTAARGGGAFRIAVLARARKHLWLIAKRLREAGITYRAVEIEELGKRQEVLDAAALARSLMHPMDRIAWLTVLHAPWCGLTLQDLHVLCGSDDAQLARRPMLELLRMRVALLSYDGQERATRVLRTLEEALRGRHRQAPFSHWLERTWQTLGGRECVDSAGYENVLAFFRMLGQLSPESVDLDRHLARLFAAPDPRVNERSGVQLMTIHKAKGLEFDVVLVPGLHEKTDSGRSSLLCWLERITLEGPQETERPEFLLAPIGRKEEERDPLYRWISKQKQRRQQDEAKRLLYVACTRASKELYLLGTATVAIDANGVESLKPGRANSLLATAWPGLKDIFRDKYELRGGNERPAPAAEGPGRNGGRHPRTHLRRLPAEWRYSVQGEQTAFPPPDRAQAKASSFERPGGSLKARAVGSVVHALFEELACLAGSAEEVAGGMDRWRPRAAAMLRQAGLPRAEAELQSAKVVRALKSALEDPVGRWILAARSEAETETSWSAWETERPDEEIISTLRADRIFRAGAVPGSREETYLWIVDYKTALHSEAGLEAFLAAEKARYEQQLELYGQMMRRVYGQELPLRLALYYPLLKRLLWWEG